MTPDDLAQLDAHTLAALIAWQAELGADEALGDAPVNRYDLPAAAARPPSVAAAPLPAPPAPQAPPRADPVAEARTLAGGAATLDDLAEAQAGYAHCDLRQGARNFVFADGVRGARVMILGEAPGDLEDREGRPFVGQAGQLLDRMLAAIGLARTNPDPARAVYITNVLPWRPPMNRDPTAAEMAMMMPFVARHIELAAPEFLVVMGNTPAMAILGQRGITKLRGRWSVPADLPALAGLPVLPMLHPAYLLRTALAKREAWADLLTLRRRLDAK